MRARGTETMKDKALRKNKMFAMMIERVVTVAVQNVGERRLGHEGPPTA